MVTLSKMFTNKVRTTFLCVLCMALLLLSACQPQVSSPSESDKLVVVTTLFPLYEFAKEVGGDEVEVILLLPFGVEPHSYEPKPSDVLKAENADVFLYVGESMEPWAHDILEGLQNKDLTVIEGLEVALGSEHEEDKHDHHEEEEHVEHGKHDHDAKVGHEDHDEHDEGEHNHEGEHHDEEHAEEGLDQHKHDHDEEVGHEDKHEGHDEHGHDHHNHGGVDPHIWLDFDHDVKLVHAIADVYASLDSEHANLYEKNAQDYAEKLKVLDEAYEHDLEDCAKDEFLVGGHNFFGYLEGKYNIEGIPAIDNLEPHAEPTPKDIQKLTDVAQEHDIKYILTETLVSQRISETIASETGASVLVFIPGANIAQDEFAAGATFLSIMQDNLDVLKLALECK